MLSRPLLLCGLLPHQLAPSNGADNAVRNETEMALEGDSRALCDGTEDAVYHEERIAGDLRADGIEPSLHLTHIVPTRAHAEECAGEGAWGRRHRRRSGCRGTSPDLADQLTPSDGADNAVRHEAEMALEGDDRALCDGAENAIDCEKRDARDPRAYGVEPGLYLAHVVPA